MADRDGVNMSDATSRAERWFPIPGWRGYYEVSDQGRVRSLDRTLVYRDGRITRHRGCVLTSAPTGPLGYMTVPLHRPGMLRRCSVHALVSRAFVGPPPDGMEGCHKDGQPDKNDLSNLEWGTRSKNNCDKQRHGTDHMRNRDACPLRHSLVMPNLVPSKLANGHRSCLACQRANSNRSYALLCGRSFDHRAAADAHYAKIMVGLPSQRVAAG